MIGLPKYQPGYPIEPEQVCELRTELGPNYQSCSSPGSSSDNEVRFRFEFEDLQNS